MQQNFKITMGELQAITGAELIGDPATVIHGVVHPLKATASYDLALILDEGIVERAKQLPIQSAIVPKGIDLPHIPNQLKVDRPKVVLAQLLSFIAKKPWNTSGVHETAVIDPTADIAEGAEIGPYVVIGENSKIGKNAQILANVYIGSNVKIGDDILICAGAKICDNSQIGNNVLLHAGCVIGDEGFSFVTPQESSMESAQKRKAIADDATNTEIIKVPCVGNVVIEDNVEIGANSCVDRGTLGETRIGKNTKIDNLVQVGHNVIIGENCLIAGMVGIAGSAKIGNRVVLAGHAGIKDNIEIGDDAIILSFTGPTKSVEKQTIMAGLPALPIRDFMYREMAIKKLIKSTPKKLDDLSARISELEKVKEPV